MNPNAGVLAPFHQGESLHSADFEGDPSTMGWLPNPEIGELWESYVQDTKIADPTPPPAPFDLKLEAGKVTWRAEADLESGLAGFLIKRNGEVIGELPRQNRNPFGRPIFQGLLYSDTPRQPLEKMEFVDENPSSSVDDYEVISKNTAGLLSDAKLKN